MHWLLTQVARVLVGLLQVLPLPIVARLGRACGHLTYGLDVRHRRVAIENLTLSLGSELSGARIRGLARENFRRIGENFACAIKTATLDAAALRRIVEVCGVEHLQANGAESVPTNWMVAIGHFGNFELYAKVAWLMPGYQFATTYRALKPPGLDRVLQTVRSRSGCLFFERRFDAVALKERLRQGGLVLGLLSDQHGGDKGVWGPFLGRDCSTTPAPAVFALRHDCPLLTAICYRVGLGRWRIEVGAPIPVRKPDGTPRSVAAITGDVNRAFETAVRRDPANWFWVHRRWKPRNPANLAAASEVAPSTGTTEGCGATNTCGGDAGPCAAEAKPASVDLPPQPSGMERP